MTRSRQLRSWRRSPSPLGPSWFYPLARIRQTASMPYPGLKSLWSSGGSICHSIVSLGQFD